MKNKGLVFSIIASGGVILTAFMSRNDTLKSEKIPEEEKSKKSMVKAYIPTIVTVGGTITCIGLSQYLDAKQISGMAVGLAFMQDKYRKYRKAVSEEVDEETMHNIDARMSKEDHMCYPALPQQEDEPMYRRFYDVFLEEEFYATMDQVKDAMYHLNRNFQLRGSALAAEFQYFIGLDETEKSKNYGWTASMFLDNGLEPWIDFDIWEKDGTWFIDYVWPPTHPDTWFLEY